MGLFDKVSQVAKTAKDQASNVAQTAKQQAANAADAAKAAKDTFVANQHKDTSVSSDALLGNGSQISPRSELANQPGQSEPVAADYIFPPAYDLLRTIPVGIPSDIFWESPQVQKKMFDLNGEKLIVSEELDRFNTCFQAISQEAGDSLERCMEEWDTEVSDFPSFWEQYPPILDKHMFSVLKLGHDMLIAEDLYLVPFETFVLQYKTKLFLSGNVFYKNMVDQIIEVRKSNASGAASSAALVATVGNVLVDGIATASAFNSREGLVAVEMLEGTGILGGIRNGITESAIGTVDLEAESAFNPEQQQLAYKGFWEDMRKDRASLLLFDLLSAIYPVLNFFDENDVKVWIPDH